MNAEERTKKKETIGAKNGKNGARWVFKGASSESESSQDESVIGLGCTEVES